jgi:hypothetical protein
MFKKNTSVWGNWNDSSSPTSVYVSSITSNVTWNLFRSQAPQVVPMVMASTWVPSLLGHRCFWIFFSMVQSVWSFQSPSFDALNPFSWLKPDLVRQPHEFAALWSPWRITSALQLGLENTARLGRSWQKRQKSLAESAIIWRSWHILTINEYKLVIIICIYI